MAEIGYYDADLTDALDKLNEIMGKLAKAPPSAKPEFLGMAEVKLKEVIELRKGYQLALRQAPRDQQRSYREKFEELNTRVEELNGEVKWARSEYERNGLFGDRLAGGPAGALGSGPLSNREVLDKALNVQKKTEKSLVNTQKMVQASKEVAVATGEQLREQREQIVTITDDVMRMEDSLARADKLIRTFARRMATDRVILVMTFFVFMGIASIVVYNAVNPDQTTFYVPDEVTPPNPEILYNKTVAAINKTIHDLQ